MFFALNFDFTECR